MNIPTRDFVLYAVASVLGTLAGGAVAVLLF